MRVQVDDVFRHFKGTEYVVIEIATHTETGEELVIYRAWPPEYIDDDKIWARSVDMFLDEVEREWYKGPRFTLIK